MTLTSLRGTEVFLGSLYKAVPVTLPVACSAQPVEPCANKKGQCGPPGGWAACSPGLWPQPHHQRSSGPSFLPSPLPSQCPSVHPGRGAGTTLLCRLPLSQTHTLPPRLGRNAGRQGPWPAPSLTDCIRSWAARTELQAEWLTQETFPFLLLRRLGIRSRCQQAWLHSEASLLGVQMTL